jgi:signal peptidase II
LNVPHRILFVLVVSGSCLLADRATKTLASALLAGHPGIELLGGTVKLTYQENRGAMLSLGADLPEPIRFWLLTVLIGVLLLALAAFVVLQSEIRTADLLAASLIIGGGGGNLIDRLNLDGAVVDFLTIGIGAIRTGVFNIADIAVIAGVVVFVFTRKEKRGGAEPPPPDPPNFAVHDFLFDIGTCRPVNIEQETRNDKGESGFLLHTEREIQ